MPPNLKILSDEQLIDAYKSTDDGAFFGELFLRYKHLILGVCIKYLRNVGDSEDALMEITEKLHLDIKQHEIKQWKGWLYMVSRNHCLMRLRKAGLKLQYPETLPEVQAQDDTLDETQTKELLLQVLNRKLGLLKKEQSECLTMFFLEEKSYKQIAMQTNFSINDIKSHLQNGKLNLKKMLLKINNA